MWNIDNGYGIERLSENIKDENALRIWIKVDNNWIMKWQWDEPNEYPIYNKHDPWEKCMCV